MKFTVSRKLLLTVLCAVASVIPKKGTIDTRLMAFLRVKRGSKAAILAGGSWECQVVDSVKIRQLQGNGDLCFPPGPVVNFLKTAETDDVICEHKDDLLYLTSGPASFEVACRKGEDFPAAPEPDKIKGRSFAVRNLKEALGKVMFAAAIEQNRPVLNSVHFHPVKGGFDLVCADGFRIATNHLRVAHTIKDPFNLPLETARAIVKLCGDQRITVLVEKPKVAKPAEEGQPAPARVVPPSPSRVTFTTGTTTIVSQLIQGTFPNYTQLIPAKKMCHRFVASAADLLKGVAMVARSGIPAEGSGIVRLQSDRKGLKVSATASEKGAVSYRVPDTRGKLKIAVNFKYLMDMLPRLEGQAVLYSTTPHSPLLIIQKGVQYVTMPMFVQWEGEPDMVAHASVSVDYDYSPGGNTVNKRFVKLTVEKPNAPWNEKVVVAETAKHEVIAINGVSKVLPALETLAREWRTAADTALIGTPIKDVAKTWAKLNLPADIDPKIQDPEPEPPKPVEAKQAVGAAA